MMSLKCETCGAALKVTDHKTGQGAKCPKCGKPFDAPLPKILLKRIWVACAVVAILSAAGLGIFLACSSNMPILFDDVPLKKSLGWGDRLGFSIKFKARPQLVWVVVLWSSYGSALLLGIVTNVKWMQRRRAEDAGFPRRRWSWLTGGIGLIVTLAVVALPLLRWHSSGLRAQAALNLIFLHTSYQEFRSNTGHVPNTLEDLHSYLPPWRLIDPYSKKGFEYFPPRKKKYPLYREESQHPLFASTVQADGYRAVIYGDGRFQFVQETEFQKGIEDWKKTKTD